MKDSLGDRMKEYYENVTRHKLVRRTPVIIRLDGKAFHTFTKNAVIKNSLKNDPFSEIMFEVMSNTALHLTKNIQNATFCYSQSDEISILLKDWNDLQTDQWFGGNIQKIASISAAMASVYFNAFYQKFLTSEFKPEMISSLPLFDSRVFNIPKEEVTNYFIWRQQDASRNSINMLAQYHFSHRELQGLSVPQVHDKLFLEKNINWNNIDIWKKRGFCIKNKSIDACPPIFTEDREYVNEELIVKE